MLTTAEIKRFIDEDAVSEKKQLARVGKRYYDAEHDILQCRLFYYNDDGNLVEDKYRSNIRIPHPFFTEIVDQAVQYLLSGDDAFIVSDIPELQKELDAYFNENEDFRAELADTVTGCMVNGFDYMHSYKDAEDRTAFQWADGIGVVEVRAKDTDANTEHLIYWYVDRIEKGSKRIKRIQVWDAEQVGFFVQADDGEIEVDESEKVNPRPHVLYNDKKGVITYEDFGCIPFFRLDNNRKQVSDVKAIKPLIDDYDVMASSLSNNLADFDTPIHVVKGFNGDNFDELQQNFKTKKIVGVDSEGGVEVHTVDIPYQARQAKLELDEKNIYRFGFGLNTSGLKDTSATTNIAIKAAYSLLELKCSKLKNKLQQFLRKLIRVVLAEINERNHTDYKQNDVYFRFEPEIMSNAVENAQIEQMEAATQQVRVNTILNVAANVGDEQTLKAICEIMEWDYDELQAQVEQMQEQEGQNAAGAIATLESVVTDDETEETEPVTA